MNDLQIFNLACNGLTAALALYVWRRMQSLRRAENRRDILTSELYREIRALQEANDNLTFRLSRYERVD
jgi:hypothetical protein